ncbi:MAG: type II CRISPR-associated endonuclease Cas1 [Bacteroidales bacterium]|nr:type II CRISPR-associated endonuclease Cas1 [Bacteroidales bacterium]
MIKRTLFLEKKASLSTRLEQLIINTDERNASVPIEDIGFIVIEHPETYVSIPALNKLVANNASVIFCNEKHMPSSMLLNLDGHYLQQELFGKQIQATEPLKKQLWQQIITHKIKNQAKLLTRLNKPPNPLSRYAGKVLSGDSDNREGAAAAYYWKNLFDFDFRRERTGEYPNLFLNYGYIILRAAVARALTGSGLLPTLGIHHHNRYNAYCLADDVMEPFRPLVDAKVVEIQKKDEEKDLTTEIKIELLSVLTHTVYFKTIQSPLMVALHQTCSSLQQCFTGTRKKINYPELWN